VNARFALLPLIVLVIACSAEAPAGTVADPIAASLTGAAEAGKNVLVMYSSETCGCCKRMDEEALADPEVKAALAKMVFVRVTKGKDAEAFESRWADAGTPSFVVLGADGVAKGEPLRGPFGAGEFLFLLDWVVEGDGPQPNIVRLPDGCGSHDGEEGEDEEGGCGGCGDEAGEAEAEGCGGCAEE